MPLFMPGRGRFLCLFVPSGDFAEGEPGITVNGVAVRLREAPILQAYSIFGVDEHAGEGEDTATRDIVIDLKSHGENTFIHRRVDSPSAKGEIAICRHSSAAVGGPFDNMRKIGHRGCGTSRHSPVFAENTIDSFLEARKRGAHAVELDIHLTTDDVPVVHHDDSIGGVLIRDMTHSGFLEAVGNEGEDTGRPVSLGLVLEALPDDLGINIELKSSGPEHFTATKDDYMARMAAAVLRRVRSYKNKSFLFSSFSIIACVYLRLLSSACNVHYLVPDAVAQQEDQESMVRQLQGFAEQVNINGFCLSTDIVYRSPGFREIIADGRFSCYCYGEATNDRKKAEELVLLGVKGLITDDLVEIQGVFAD